MAKIRTTVRIAGKEYTLTSNDSEAYVQRVATYVDRKITEMSLATRLPAAQLTAMTAVTIADDLFKARDELTRLKKELDETRLRLEQMEREDHDR